MDHQDFYEAVLPARDDAYYLLWDKTTRGTYSHLGFQAFLVAAGRQALGTDWYYATAAYSAPKRLNENVVAIKAFRLDLDAGEAKFAKHPERAYPHVRDAAAALADFMRRTGLIPTYVVRSGFGLHVYYALDEECSDLDAWQSTARAFSQVVRGHGLKDDPAVTTDRGRLLRPLGSMHAEAGERVQIVRGPMRTWAFEDFAAAVNELAPEEDQALIAARPGTASRARAEELYADLGIDPSYEASFHKAALKCAVLADSMAAPEKLDHDTWFKVMVIADNSIEGRELAHEISAADADRYDARALDKRLDTFKSDTVTCRSFSDQAPQCRTCAFFGKINTPRELGRLSDEALAEIRPQAEAPEAPEASPSAGFAAAAELELPEDFPLVDGQELGGVTYRLHLAKDAPISLVGVERSTRKDPVTGVEGTADRAHVLTHDLFYFSGWADVGGADDVAYALRVRSRDGTWSSSPMASGIVTDRGKLITYLSQRGVHPATVTNKALELLHRYTMSLIDLVKNQRQRPGARHRLGFQFTNRGEPVYIQGRYAVMADGTLVSAMHTNLIRGHIDSLSLPALAGYTGEVFPDAYWETLHEHAKTFTEGLRVNYEGRALHQLTLLMGMASVFMPFVDTVAPNEHTGTMPDIGGVISLYSADSGHGKSALQDLIASAFYEPSKFKASGNERAAGSATAMASTATMMGCLPVVMDEVTNNDPEFVSGLVYKISSGKDRARARPDGGIKPTHGWSLIASLSTNVSQRELLTAHRKTADAEQLRLLELNFDLHGRTDGGIGDYAEWHSKYIAPNIGALGLLIAREALLACQAGGYKQLNAAARRAQTMLQNKYQLSKAERYAIRMGAAAQLLHLVLKRMDLVFYDYEAVMKQFHSAVVQMRNYLDDNKQRAEDVIDSLLSDLKPGMYVSESEIDGRGRPRKGEATGPRAERPLYVPRGAVKGRFVNSGRYAYVAVDAIAEWCRENNLTLGALERMAIAEDLLHLFPDHKGVKRARRQIMLTKGLVDEPALRATCWTVNLAKLNYEVDLPSGDTVGTNVVSLQRSANPPPPPDTRERIN
jgi:hypothetical protein